MPRSFYIQFISEVSPEKIREYFQHFDFDALTQETECSYSVHLCKNIDSQSIANFTKSHFLHDEYILCTGQAIHGNKPDPASSVL